jgi:hypothetical protein
MMCASEKDTKFSAYFATAEEPRLRRVYEAQGTRRKEKINDTLIFFYPYALSRGFTYAVEREEQSKTTVQMMPSG